MVVKKSEKTEQEQKDRVFGYSSFAGTDTTGLNFRPQIFFDAPDDSGGGGDDNNDDKPDNNNNDNNSNDNDTPDIEALKAEWEKEKKKELDSYRTEVGHLKKEIKEMKEKGMSEEEKLDARAKELQEKEQELRVKELNAHKSQQIAEQELDKSLADYIKVNAEKSEDDITEDITALKTAVDGIVQKRIEQLQESGSVLNGFNMSKKKKDNSKGSIGKELANYNNNNNKGAAEAQDNYFK